MTGPAGQKLRRSIFWTVGASLAALAAAATNPLLLIIAIPIWAMAHRRIRHPEQMQASRATLGALSLVIFALLLLSLSLEPREFIEAFSLALAGLILVKLFDRVTARDQALLLCMSTSLVVGAALLYSSAVIGLLLAVYLLLALRTAALLQVAIVEERAGRADRGATWRLVRRGAVASGAAVVAVMVAVFIVMPRGLISAPPAFSGQPTGAQNVSGFDDQIDLTQTGEIQESFEPVMEIDVLEGSSLPVPGDRLYLRGAVLEQYADGLQQMRTREFGRLPAENRVFTMLDPSFEPTTRLRIRFLRDDPPTRLFTLGVPHSIKVTDGAAVLEGDRATGEVQVGQGFVREYVLAASLLSRGDAETPLLEPAFQDGSIKDFADELLAAQGIERDPAERHSEQDERIVRFFERHLRQNYAYTTRPPPVAAGADPIEAFLFDHRTGHCERFATALAAMTRAVGVEARVVTGYLTTERAGERRFIAREAHAHAWVEAHVEPGLWLRFDASPPGGVAEAHRVPTGPIAAMQTAWRWANDLWVRNVVSYDRRAQTDLLGARYDAALDRALGKPPTITSLGGLAGILRSLAIGVGVFALTLLIGAAAPRLRRIWDERARGPGRVSTHRHVRLADRALARAGFPRHPSVPMRAHAAAIRGSHREGARAYDRLARLHYQERFGDSGAASESRAAELVERLRRALRERSA